MLPRYSAGAYKASNMISLDKCSQNTDSRETIMLVQEYNMLFLSRHCREEIWMVPKDQSEGNKNTSSQDILQPQFTAQSKLNHG
jgi:hypothetical protein